MQAELRAEAWIQPECLEGEAVLEFQVVKRRVSLREIEFARSAGSAEERRVTGYRRIRHSRTDELCLVVTRRIYLRRG